MWQHLLMVNVPFSPQVLASLVMVLVVCNGDHQKPYLPAPSKAYKQPTIPSCVNNQPTHPPAKTSKSAKACAVHHVTVWERECSIHYRYTYVYFYEQWLDDFSSSQEWVHRGKEEAFNHKTSQAAGWETKEEDEWGRKVWFSASEALSHGGKSETSYEVSTPLICFKMTNWQSMKYNDDQDGQWEGQTRHAAPISVI